MDRRNRALLIAGFVVTALLAGVVSTIASSQPDGLERVAIDEGFEDSATDGATSASPLADYAVEGVENDRVGTGLAGIIGAVVTMAAMIGLLYGARALRRRDNTSADA